MKKDKIESSIRWCWESINKMEERIQELARRGKDYTSKTHKRKLLLNKVRRLDDEKRQN